MISAALRQSFGFMLTHAGYCTPPGRAVCALDLARAELLLADAETEGAAAVEWVWDDEPWDEGMEISADEAARRFESGEWTGPLGCVVRIGDDVAASLWGIVVGSRGTDDPYCRVVAAELAREIEDDLRQAVGDARDEREMLA